MDSIDPTFVVVIVIAAIVGVVVIGAAIGIGVWAARRSPQGARGPQRPKVPPLVAWQTGGPALQQLGMQSLDAECYTRSLDSGTLYLRFDVSDGAIFAWTERACPGCVLELFLGATVELSPGGRAHSDFANVVAGAVGELFSALPRGAKLKVKAPEIPGDQYELRLTTPLFAPEHPTLVARILLALDEAVRRPPPAGSRSQARLPPVALHWQAAAPAIQALRMGAATAELYTGSFDGSSGTLYLSVDIREGSIRGWTERAAPGCILEPFAGQSAELSPGARGHSPLAQLISGAIGELFAALPRGASLRVKAPEIPGDNYELTLSTPLTAPEQAPLVVRVLRALDEAVRHPAPPEMLGRNLPPAVRHWQAAAPSLQALGLSMLDAECFTRALGGPGGTLYLKLHVGQANVRGWIERACPEGIIEQFRGHRGELAPGRAPRSPLEQLAAGAVYGIMATLPHQARLSIKAPEIPGGNYELSLESPLTSPEQPMLVARTLLALDEAVRGPMR